MYSAGRMAEVEILKGVLAIIVSQDHIVNTLKNIEMLDVLRSHRPAIAK